MSTPALTTGRRLRGRERKVGRRVSVGVMRARGTGAGAAMRIGCIGGLGGGVLGMRRRQSAQKPRSPGPAVYSALQFEHATTDAGASMLAVYWTRACRFPAVQ